MAGYDQKIKVKSYFEVEARKFFSFLQKIGRRYSRPVKIKYRYLGRGFFYVFIDGGSGGIDALFQELILNRGLYYYACTLGNKDQIISSVIVPIFRQLIDERFENSQSRFLRKHILGKYSQREFIPGEFHNSFSHEYEILFRKWDIGIIDDWNFIKDLDSFLTNFMLKEIGHHSGQESPAFGVLTHNAYNAGLGIGKDIKKYFNVIHKARTDGLHRLKNDLTHEEISNIATQLYIYFQYFEEFKDSQEEKTDKLHGRRYKRIKYGGEKWFDENGKPYCDDNGKPFDWKEISKIPCHDCSAIQGQYHCSGCDVEQCPRCKGQRLGCGCKLSKDFD